jgi:hypothetical protein
MGSREIYRRRQRIQIAIGIVLVALILAILLFANFYEPG